MTALFLGLGFVSYAISVPLDFVSSVSKKTTNWLFKQAKRNDIYSYEETITKGSENEF